MRTEQSVKIECEREDMGNAWIQEKFKHVDHAWMNNSNAPLLLTHVCNHCAPFDVVHGAMTNPPSLAKSIGSAPWLLLGCNLAEKHRLGDCLRSLAITEAAPKKTLHQIPCVRMTKTSVKQGGGFRYSLELGATEQQQIFSSMKDLNLAEFTDEVP